MIASRTDFKGMRPVLLAVLPLAMLLSPGLAQSEDPLAILDSAANDVRQAAEAVTKLQARQDIQLSQVLSAMKGKSAVARNWYLSLAQTVSDRDPELATRELNQFLPRLSEDPSARYWAFLYLTRGNEELRKEMLASMLADPCLELRFDAVALQLDRLKENKSLNEAQRVSGYRELLAAARLPEQVQEVAKQLGVLSQEVNLFEHFGFLSEWKSIGPFDNVGQIAFDTVYPPEQAYLAGKLATNDLPGCQGKSGEVAWKTASTTADDGAIDFNASYDNEKGAIVYALGQFASETELPCEVRIGSPNAIKVWINGDLAISREVYHASTQIDQYSAPVKLKPGANTILIKVCQNEQTDSWAQDFAFQLRFTDSTGLAIKPSAK